MAVENQMISVYCVNGLRFLAVCEYQIMILLLPLSPCNFVHVHKH
jgi:hypothetical protein